MKLTEASLSNRVAVMVAIILVVIFGFISLNRLPIQMAPNVERPTINISTTWPGAAPEEIESEILELQENVFRGMPGVERLSATASYASAGAMHVLAVSGLHVGILLLVLLNISKPLDHLKHGKYIRVVIVILGIWSYAFITGLSPSVLRAATMFTFVYLGRFGKRDVSIYNGLLASAFFLLMLQPNLIFQVGFQLSYAAVLGILYLQPKFYGLISKPRIKIVDKAWAITCVSFAAQIATFPFSIYYFLQLV